MLSVVMNMNLGLSFLLELCLLAAFAVWGIRTGQSTLMKILLGIGVPLLAAVFWGVFLSPRADIVLPNLAVQMLKFVIFGLGVVALAISHHPILAWVFGTTVVINRLLENLNG